LNDPRSTDDETRARPRIPTVTDLADVVLRSRAVPPERRPEVFHAAQQVCAEELRMVRTGFAPASLEDLAGRVVRLLPSELGGERYPGWSWDQEAPFPEEPLDDSVPSFAPGEPFAESVPPGRSGATDSPIVSYAAPGVAGGEPAERLDGEPADDLDGEPREGADDEPAEPSGDEPAEYVDFAMHPSRSAASSGKLLTSLLLVAIAGGVYFFAQTKRPAPPAAVPAGEPNPAVPNPAAATTSAAPAKGREETSIVPPGTPSIVPPGTPSIVPPSPLDSASPSTPAPPAVPESRGASMISPDWAGRAAVYMIHFSSFQRKENAERDAARLAKVLGRPPRVIGVNLGAQGYWYRVMLGDFRTREEADGEREALAAKGTPGMGLVYMVSAVSSPRVPRP